MYRYQGFFLGQRLVEKGVYLPKAFFAYHKIIPLSFDG